MQATCSVQACILGEHARLGACNKKKRTMKGEKKTKARKDEKKSKKRPRSTLGVGKHAEMWASTHMSREEHRGREPLKGGELKKAEEKKGLAYI